MIADFLLVDATPAGAASSSLRAIGLYSAVVLGGVASVLWRADIALYLLAALLPLQTTRYHLQAFPLGANMVDLLILSALLGALLRRKEPLTFKTGVKPLLIFLGIFYFFSLWRGAFYLGGSLPLWFDDERLVDYKNFMVMPMLTFAVVFVLRTRRQILMIVVLTCLTSLAVDYSYLKSSQGREFTHYSEETRDAGPLGYAGENGLACYSVEITAFLLPLLAMPRRYLFRALVLVVVAANCWTILFSYSREAYIALAAALLLIAVLKLRILLIPLFLFALSWHAVLPTAVQERIGMTYSSSSAGSAKLDASAQERVMLWTDAISLFHENPVFGSGFLTYAHMNRVGSYRDTHNFYLKMLVETGLVGLLLFIGQLMLFFVEGFGLFRHSADKVDSLLGLGFAMMIVCAGIVNFFGDRWMYIQVDSNLWILLGCVLLAKARAFRRDTFVPAPSFTSRELSQLPASLRIEPLPISYRFGRTWPRACIAHRASCERAGESA